MLSKMKTIIILAPNNWHKESTQIVDIIKYYCSHIGLRLEIKIEFQNNTKELMMQEISDFDCRDIEAIENIVMKINAETVDSHISLSSALNAVKLDISSMVEAIEKGLFLESCDTEHGG
jgi:hypothetical protein